MKKFLFSHFRQLRIILRNKFESFPTNDPIIPIEIENYLKKRFELSQQEEQETKKEIIPKKIGAIGYNS